MSCKISFRNSETNAYFKVKKIEKDNDWKIGIANEEITKLKSLEGIEKGSTLLSFLPGKASQESLYITYYEISLNDLELVRFNTYKEEAEILTAKRHSQNNILNVFFNKMIYQKK